MQVAKTAAERLLAGSLTPPPSVEAPSYPMPPNTIVYVSEEASPSYIPVYHGTVAKIKYDVQALERVMPMWLMEYLLLNQLPPVPPHQKISFVLLPCLSKDPKEQLPELLNQ